MTHRLLPLWLIVAAALTSIPVLADEGHDHGASPAATGGPTLPRFAAVSELFELVGVIDGQRLTVYLDRSADNSPVPGATVELEVGGAKVTLKEHEPGSFEGALAAALAPGITAVTATVVAGTDTDVLAADLDVHGAASVATHEPSAMAPAWRRYGPWAIAGALLAAVLALSLRRVATARRARVGGVA